MLQAMLTQRTEYLHEVQTAAAEREEQLQGHFTEQHGLAMGELQARLETEAQNGASLARQSPRRASSTSGRRSSARRWLGLG